MQFSIFGVPFKCTKDMFDQDKLVWSACVFWAVLWRSLIVWAGIFLVSLFVFGGVGVLSIFGDTSSVVLVGLMMFVTIAMFFCNLLIFALVEYYSLFRKRYKSFDHSNPEYVASVKLISWEFGRPYLVISGLMFVANIVATALFFGAGSALFLFAMFLFHITLHGGTWGFVPVSKGQKIEATEVKS